MSKNRVIHNDESGNEYLIPRGQANYYSPPEEAHRKYHIAWKTKDQLKIPSDQHYALGGVIKSDLSFIPEFVKQEAEIILRKYPGRTKDEKWIRWMYDEVGGSYSPNGSYVNIFINSVALNSENKKSLKPEWSLACMLIREFDPEQEPRIDLLDNWY